MYTHKHDPPLHFPYGMVGLGLPINQFLWNFWCRRGTPFCRKRPVCTHPTSLYMKTRSYASVRHLHFVEDLEYHFVEGYGELINTSTNVNIFEHRQISMCFWLAQHCRPPPTIGPLCVSLAMVPLAFFVMVVLGSGVKVDDTATMTPEEWLLVCERS